MTTNSGWPSTFNACGQWLQARTETSKKTKWVNVTSLFVHYVWWMLEWIWPPSSHWPWDWWSRWWEFCFAKAQAQYCHKCAADFCPSMEEPDFPAHLYQSHQAEAVRLTNLISLTVESPKRNNETWCRLDDVTPNSWRRNERDEISRSVISGLSSAAVILKILLPA